MKVSEVIKKLQAYKSNAEVTVIANNKDYKFSFTTGGGVDSDVPEEQYDTVSFYVDELNSQDNCETIGEN